MARVLFFASLKDDVGLGELELSKLPATVGELFVELASHLNADAIASLRSDNVRIAVDQALIEGDADLSGATEIAFLPPVTGG